MPDATALRGSLSALKRQLPGHCKDRKSKGIAVWKVTVSFQYRVLDQQSPALLGHHVVYGWGGRESRQKSGYKMPAGAVTHAKERIGRDISFCQQTPKGCLRCAPNTSVSFCLPLPTSGVEHFAGWAHTVRVSGLGYKPELLHGAVLSLKSAIFSHLCRNTYLN